MDLYYFLLQGRDDLPLQDWDWFNLIAGWTSIISFPLSIYSFYLTWMTLRNTEQIRDEFQTKLDRSNFKSSLTHILRVLHSNYASISKDAVLDNEMLDSMILIYDKALTYSFWDKAFAVELQNIRSLSKQLRNTSATPEELTDYASSLSQIIAIFSKEDEHFVDV